MAGATGQAIRSADGLGPAVQQVTAGAQPAQKRDGGVRGLFRRAATQVGTGARQALSHLGEAGVQHAARRVADVARVGRGRGRSRKAGTEDSKERGPLRKRLFKRR